MVKQQAEALRLADELATCVQHGLNSHSLMEDAAAELRRLHGENVAQRKALRTYISTIDQFHHAVADAGWHPGRTDDLLTDIIREKGKEMRRLHNVNKELLEALQAFPGFTDDAAAGDLWLEKMRAAVAKATGGQQ